MAVITGSDENNPILVKPAEKASSCTAIVFSSVNSNQHSFYNLFEKFRTKLNRIYVRDPSDMWYVNGVSKAANNWGALIRELGSSCLDLGTKRLMVFGSSMGAYAALRCCLDIHVDICLATSPQTLLDPRLPHTPEGDVDSASRDISYRLSEPTDTVFKVFFGAADFVDIFNVSRVNWPQAAVYPVAEHDHLVAQRLAKAGVYERLITQFINEGRCNVEAAMEYCRIPMDFRVMDPVAALLCRRVIESRYLGGVRAVAPMLKALEALGPFADGRHILAQTLSSDGKHDLAASQARAALQLAPTSVTIADTLAEVLRRAGQSAEAIEAYKHCLTLRPKHYSALCALAELTGELGDMASAKRYLHEAVAIRPRLNRAQTIAERLGLSPSNPFQKVGNEA